MSGLARVETSYVTYWIHCDITDEFVYEWHSTWDAPNNGVKVWPKGVDPDHVESTGWLSFGAADPNAPQVITLDWVLDIITRHENREFWPTPPDDLDEDDLADWQSDMMYELHYYDPPSW